MSGSQEAQGHDAHTQDTARIPRDKHPPLGPLLGY
jgi:hypothetical protein